jgi:thioesterase-3
MSPPFPGIEVEVQSTHVDMFGHLNHTKYLEYMEWARFAWSAHEGFPIDRMVLEQRMGPAVLRVNIQYRRECRLGDRLHVTVEPQSRRRAIGVLRQVLTDVRTGDRVCEAELAFAMLDLDTRKVVPLPQAFVDSLPKEPAEAKEPAE